MKRKIAKQIVDDIADDLSDGAYFALIEEFLGIPSHLFDEPRSQEKTIPCPHCVKKFVSTFSLKQHTLAKHKGNP